MVEAATAAGVPAVVVGLPVVAVPAVFGLVVVAIALRVVRAVVPGVVLTGWAGIPVVLLLLATVGCWLVFRRRGEAKDDARARTEAERVARTSQPRASSRRQEKGMVEQIAGSTVFRQFARSAGREIVRGLFGAARKR